MDSIEEYFKIQDFLAGRLSKEETRIFENEVKSNEPLKESLTKHRLANKLLLENKLIQVKEITQLVHNNETKHIKHKQLALKILGLIGLGTILLILINNRTIFDKKTDANVPTLNLPKKENNNPINEESAKVLKPKEIVIKHNNSTKNILPIKHSTVEVQQKDTVINVVTVKNQTETNNPTIPNVVQSASSGKENTIKNLNPCQLVDIKFNSNISPSCRWQNDGAISVSSINGGLAPYNYYLLNGDGNRIEILNNLKSGNYTLLVADANQCQKEVNIKIPEKNCPIHHFIDLSSSKYLFLEESDHEGIFTVADNANGIFYNSNIPANTSYTWDGKNLNGISKPGVYLYTIDYKDKIISGTITITE